MALTASLPMYDLPELRPAAEAVWRSLARALRRAGLDGVPPALTWRPARELWRDLLFSQSCGYPLTHGFAGRLRPVATPCYRAEGCAGATYRSAVVVAAGSDCRSFADCRGRICAVNSWDSLSGWQALAAKAAALAGTGRFFAGARLTGGHLASAAAVAEGASDLAAIDAVCWAHIGRHRPALARRLRVVAWTDPAPGLPFVASADAEDRVVVALREALSTMLRDDAVAGHRDTLLLSGVEILEAGHYGAVRTLAERAAALGRPALLAA